MKICQTCGSENKEKNKFCVKCGSKFPVASPFDREIVEFPDPVQEAAAFEDPEKTEIIRDDYTDSYAFENEETMILGDQQDTADFENEETMILGDEQDMSAFENEETVILDDEQDVSAFENEETVILDDQQDAVCDTADLRYEEREDPPAAPNFGYEGEIPVYRDPQNDVESETAYIDHLRRLKGLLDDGIITEWEFEQKKKQILGIEQ